MIVRRSTLTIRSTIGISKKRPGPFGSGKSRPSRKTMPRSYSRATLIAAIEEEHDQEEDDDAGRSRRQSRVDPTPVSGCQSGCTRRRQPLERVDHDALARARAARPRLPARARRARARARPRCTTPCMPDDLLRADADRRAVARRPPCRSRSPSRRRGATVSVTTSGIEVWYGAGAFGKSVGEAEPHRDEPAERQHAVGRRRGRRARAARPRRARAASRRSETDSTESPKSEATSAMTRRSCPGRSPRGGRSRNRSR